jgi:hypothetical protein
MLAIITFQLHQSALRKGAGALADDDMIQGPDLHQGQGLFHTLRNALIGLARLGHAARVVVGVMCPKSLCGASCDSFDVTITRVGMWTHNFVRIS